MKLDIKKQRKAVRLMSSSAGLNNEMIAELTDTSSSTIKRLKRKFKRSGQSWEELKSLSDDMFRKALGTEPKKVTKKEVQIDWEEVSTELQIKGMTLFLIWEKLAEQNVGFISYSQFCRLYRKYCETSQLAMPIRHIAGERLYVDFSGLRIPIADDKTGEVSYAEIFVATLGASGYTFVNACQSQKVYDWLLCHMKAFEFFGGVTDYIVPDNLKSAVIKNNSLGITINQSFEDFAEHYNIAIDPARPYQPKDKGIVESAVKEIQRRILAPLNSVKFFSIDDLNQAILPLLDEFNQRETRSYPKGRFRKFVEIEQGVLKPLPYTNYVIPEDWKHGVKVPKNYLVQYKDKSYSVPYEYRHKTVDLNLRQGWLYIFYQRREIAKHNINTNDLIVINLDHLHHDHKIFYEYQPDFIKEWAKEVGQNTSDIVCRYLRRTRQYAEKVRQLNGFIRMVKNESLIELVEEACTRAKEVNSKDLNYIKKVLKRLANAERPLTKVKREHKNIRGAAYFSDNEVAS